MPALLILGPAGSGKSTLVQALSGYLATSDLYSSIVTCNLDPGSDDDFPWDVDVRDSLTLSEIMKNYDLGPNGAVIKSYELLTDEIEHLSRHLAPVDNSSFVLIDAPGQLEPLIFMSSGDLLISKMSELFTDMIALFLMPGDIISKPLDYAFLTMIIAGLQLKINIPLIQIISKSDLMDKNTETYLQDPLKFKEAIIKEGMGQYTEYALYAAEMIEKIIPLVNLIKVQITPGGFTGFEDLIGIINEIKCSCGDLS
ncbi:MAG: ATP/GTP-binding protein [Promethearchaeota archaeon]